MFLLLSPVVVTFAIAGIFAAGIAALSWQRRDLPGAAIFTWLMIAVMLWALAESLENAVVGLEAKLLFAQMSHLGIQAVPPLFLIFVLIFTQRSRQLTRLRLVALWCIPAAAVTFVFTNDIHRLFWRQITLTPLAIGHDTVFEYGPLFWLVATAQYALLVLSIYLLIQFLVSQRDVYRRQALMVLVGALLPGLTTLLYIFHRNPLPGVDWTPVAFVVAGLLTIYAISRLQLFDIVPVAHGLLVEKTPDALLVLDTAWRVVDANPAAYQLLPITHWLVGSNLTALLPRTSGILEMLVEEDDAQACLRVDLSNGVQWVEARCTPLVGPDATLGGHLLLLRDVTAQQAAFRELRQARDAARAAARVKDGFLATMSHELRTPLTGVLGLAEALQNEALGELNPRQHRALEIIERSGRRLSSLIGAILDLSSMEAGELQIQMQTLPAVELCQQCIDAIRPEAALRRHRVVYTIHPSELVVRLDMRRMGEALGYLLDNAAKFMADGGELGLEVQEENDGGVRFTVWDRGIGVAQEDQQAIFEPFTQVDGGLARGYGGAGIGLALAHRLVQLHGGHIEVDSVPGGGSRFIVVLPPQPATVAREAAA